MTTATIVQNNIDTINRNLLFANEDRFTISVDYLIGFVVGVLIALSWLFLERKL